MFWLVIWSGWSPDERDRLQSEFAFWELDRRQQQKRWTLHTGAVSVTWRSEDRTCVDSGILFPFICAAIVLRLPDLMLPVVPHVSFWSWFWASIFSLFPDFPKDRTAPRLELDIQMACPHFFVSDLLQKSWMIDVSEYKTRHQLMSEHSASARKIICTITLLRQGPINHLYSSRRTHDLTAFLQNI